MNRIMLDSVSLPGMQGRHADLIAYYLNGRYAVSSVAMVETMFPGVGHVPIDVLGDRPDYARVFDVETGDIQPEHCEQIITDYQAHSRWYKSGGRPVMYCDRANIGNVRMGTGRYILGRDWYLWVSDPGGMYSGPGVVACQNVWSRTYNSSVVFSPEWMPGS